MCTVTFIPTRNSVFFTANRDEKRGRAAATPPAIYQCRSGKILFPKDPEAGGTWIALHENSNLVVLLNGAFKAHHPTPPYRRSRGLVLLDIIDHSQPRQAFADTDLDNIEPFTAIVWDSKHLIECRWDGKDKYAVAMDTRVPHIWASATLFNDEAVSKRNDWFTRWLRGNAEPRKEDILEFHRSTGEGDIRNDLVINRDNSLSTLSITSVEVSENTLDMDYLDLRTNTHSRKAILPESIMAGK